MKRKKNVGYWNEIFDASNYIPADILVDTGCMCEITYHLLKLIWVLLLALKL